ncbi:MAG TPA: alanine racemase [Candidatus Obscuribacterales bacterium]
MFERPEIARDWLQQHGSPVHVVVASEFERNVNDLLSALHSRGLSGGLFFARKANKLPWFVTMAKEQGIGVDTASLNEVRETLELGISPDQIIVTAVGKEHELVAEAAGKGCLLVIDNADEMELVRSVARSLGKTARIGLRFSGFQVGGRAVFSRFGFPIGDAGELVAGATQSEHVKLELLHAHLDRYDTEERATAAQQLIKIADHLATLGHPISGIDLGGGILIRYLEKESEWQAFLQQLVASVKGDEPPFTYRDDGLGYYRVGNEVQGQADLYPAWNKLSKERFLAAVLDHRQDGIPLHRQLSERGLRLFFEPGRALLDNTGVTLARTAFRKRDTLGNLLIGLAMNRTNLRPFRAEFCSDPILLTSEPRSEMTEGAFLVGNLCSEGDILFRRKIDLRHLPEPGDVFAFANTAGYLAHHLEIGTHGNPLPRNLLVDSRTFEVRQVFA